MTLLSTLSPTFVPVLAAMKESLGWGLVVLFIVLGMLVTLQPVNRTKEVKGRKE